MTYHHYRLIGEAGEATDDGGVVGKVAIAVQFLEVAEDIVDVVQRVRTLGVACHLRNLPRMQLAVDLLGERVALLLQPADLLGDVQRRVVLHVAQLLDLRLQLGDGLLELEKSMLHGLP
jgi:hypothetical protein